MIPPEHVEMIVTKITLHPTVSHPQRGPAPPQRWPRPRLGCRWRRRWGRPARGWRAGAGRAAGPPPPSSLPGPDTCTEQAAAATAAFIKLDWSFYLRQWAGEWVFAVMTSTRKWR